MRTYGIMIVEDEPPIIRRIRRIIEKNPNGFEIISEVNNGQEALAAVPKIRPDVVLTDIKMPLMNGLELSRVLYEQYPDIITIIISGYNDFNYAKEALKYGVADYLLKPIEPGLLYQVLSEISKKLDKTYYHIEVGILKKLMRSQAIDTEIMHKHFNYSCFNSIVIKSGPLARRLAGKASSGCNIPFDSIMSSEIDKICNMDIYWVVEGRDEFESVIIFPNDKMDANTVKALSKNIFDILENNNFITIAYSEDFFEIDRLAEIIRNLYQTLDNNLVIGKNTIVCNNFSGFSEKLCPPILGSNQENKFNILIQSKSINILKNEFYSLYQTWEKQALPQILVERLLKQVFRLIEKISPDISTKTSMNIEQQLEDIFAVANSFNDLATMSWELAEGLVSGFHSTDGIKKEEQTLLEKIDVYINIHIAETLTLQNVCDLFGINQPYLSRLFRKYKNTSFNEYVTILRVSEAKRLMEEQPEMLFKDIAEIVGYQDQHYFSRIFKAVTGLAPSKYKESNS